MGQPEECGGGSLLGHVACGFVIILQIYSAPGDIREQTLCATLWGKYTQRGSALQ